MFQSRAGFSECLDEHGLISPELEISFNPVLGFLSVSTQRDPRSAEPRHPRFQSRAGFSECLDVNSADVSEVEYLVSIPCWVF